MNIPKQFDPKTPSSLLRLQQWTAKIVTKPLGSFGPLNLPIYDLPVENEIGQILSPGKHLSAAQSIAIYNQQYWFRFFTLAQENFPTLVRLFGYADFNRSIVEPAILKYPSDSWFLLDATTHLPRWIEEEYQAEDKSFILQMAQIDAAFYISPASSKKTTLEFDPHLVEFRKLLLAQAPEYWLEHDFPSTQE